MKNARNEKILVNILKRNRCFFQYIIERKRDRDWNDIKRDGFFVSPVTAFYWRDHCWIKIHDEYKKAVYIADAETPSFDVQKKKT